MINWVSYNGSFKKTKRINMGNIIADKEIITPQLIEDLSLKARNSNRLRVNYNFHKLSDNVQRMLNVISTNSYVRPHCHISAKKNEMFVLLRGEIHILFYDKFGEIKDVVTLSENGNRGVDIKPNVWHSALVLKGVAVCFETKDGPYIKEDDKDFASWAPEEYSTESEIYVNKLREFILK